MKGKKRDKNTLDWLKSFIFDRTTFETTTLTETNLHFT